MARILIISAIIIAFGILMNTTFAYHSGDRDGTYDGVYFTTAEETEALDIANNASRTQIQSPGDISDPQRTTIIDGRPWSSLQEVSDASGIDTATMQALLDYVQTEGYYAWTGRAHDLNNALQGELTEISGIGPATAGSIFNHRQNYNYFEEEDHLMSISGIGTDSVDAWKAANPGIYVSSYTDSGYEQAVHDYFSAYPRVSEIVTVNEVTGNLGNYENKILRFQQAAVTYVSNPQYSSVFYIGDWEDTDTFTPESSSELKVYMNERNNAKLLDPYDIWEVSDGEPYSRANFYKEWNPLSGSRIDENHVYSIEGVLINDPVYGWELVVRADWYAGEDRITLLEKWLAPEDWLVINAFFDKPHIGAKVQPEFSSGWTISIPERLVYAHPCIDYAISQGETPPTSSPYFGYEDPKPEFVTWFEYWLYQWKNAPDAVPLISEVYIDADDEYNSEFIELYNPGDAPVDISGWDIYDGSGVEAEITSGIIPAHGYFLIADGGWSTGKDNPAWPDADLEDEMSLPNTDHGIALRDASDVVVDSFGWGSPGSGEPYEGTPAPNPSGEGYSYERHQGQDTDDNTADFFENEPENVNPQSSAQETPTPSATPSPTQEPTEAPTEMPTEQPTEQPTLPPSPTLTPSTPPTSTPTQTPTVIPTTTPTSTPTSEPPTLTPTETPTSPTPSPTDTSEPPPVPATGTTGAAILLILTGIILLRFHKKN